MDIAQAHADNLAGCDINALHGVLIVAVMPPGERVGRVGFAKLGRHAAWEEDLEHELSHEFVFEGGEVDVVDALDVGDQGGQNDELHLQGLL